MKTKNEAIADFKDWIKRNSSNIQGAAGKYGCVYLSMMEADADEDGKEYVEFFIELSCGELISTSYSSELTGESGSPESEEYLEAFTKALKEELDVEVTNDGNLFDQLTWCESPVEIFNYMKKHSIKDFRKAEEAFVKDKGILIEDVYEAIVSRFKIHPWISNERYDSFTIMGNCGCHERVMDLNCENKDWGYNPFNPEFTKLLDELRFYAEAENNEALTIRRI